MHTHLTLPFVPPALNVSCKSNFPKCPGDPSKDMDGSRAEGEGIEKAAGWIGAVGLGLHNPTGIAELSQKVLNCKGA